MTALPYFKVQKHLHNAITKLQKPNNGTPFELAERMDADAALAILHEYVTWRTEQDAPDPAA